MNFEFVGSGAGMRERKNLLVFTAQANHTHIAAKSRITKLQEQQHDNYVSSIQ